MSDFQGGQVNVGSDSQRLHAAALAFEILPEGMAETDSRASRPAREVVGPLKTTAILLDDGTTRVCLITTHFGTNFPINASEVLRNETAETLGITKEQVILFSSHNHCSVAFVGNGMNAYDAYGDTTIPAPEWQPAGEEFRKSLRACAKRLSTMLEPVTVWWAEGKEGRFTYRRKGRRADGSSYLIREHDRQELGEDFQGDVDTQAPIVVLKNERGKAVALLTQFTGHPVTSFHPEKPVVFGEYPQVACDVVAEFLEASSPAPIVGFLQGCAGDVNAKEMLSGSVERATEFGQMLGQSYVDALNDLKRSQRDGLDFTMQVIKVPLAPLPDREQLVAELEEMDAFLERADAGNEDTLICVGQNFPPDLSPKYRAWLVKLTRPWNVWALNQHAEGPPDSVAKHLEMEIAVLRLGDVGIVGLPCEPFQGIGRQIREGSVLPTTIPCGYMNVSHGYITDGENTGDGEYMSSHYRYTRYRPPLRKPAGDVLADSAVKILNRFAREDNHEAN